MIDRSLIAKLSLFANLQAGDLDELLQEARSVRYPKNTHVFEQGGEAVSFFVLLHGHIRAEKSTPDGEKIVVRYVSPGEIFGVAEAIGNFDRRCLRRPRDLDDPCAGQNETPITCLVCLPVIGTHVRKRLYRAYIKTEN